MRGLSKRASEKVHSLKTVRKRMRFLNYFLNFVLNYSDKRVASAIVQVVVWTSVQPVGSKN